MMAPVSANAAGAQDLARGRRQIYYTPPRPVEAGVFQLGDPGVGLPMVAPAPPCIHMYISCIHVYACICKICTPAWACLWSPRPPRAAAARRGGQEGTGARRRRGDGRAKSAGG